MNAAEKLLSQIADQIRGMIYHLVEREVDSWVLNFGRRIYIEIDARSIFSRLIKRQHSKDLLDPIGNNHAD